MEPDSDRLLRYLSGESPPEERDAILRWAEGDPANAVELQALGRLWALTPNATRMDDVSALWAGIREQIDEDGGTPAPPVRSLSLHLPHRGGTSADAPPPGRPTTSRAPRVGRPLSRWIAASAVGVAAVALLFTAAPAFLRPTARPTAGASVYTVYTTRPGERATIDLSDGTRVYLNVASTLEVPRTFGSAGRHVHLIGQAVFEVAHAAASPFTVDAAGTRTTVLGTSFDVRAYDADVRVAVRAGKVAVAACDLTGLDDGCPDAAHRRVVLAENDAALVSPAGRLSVRRGVDVTPDFVFSTGRLVLTGAPLATLVPELNRWYDADVRLADSSLAARVLGGWFPAGTADDLVQYFTVVLKVRAVRDGRVITLYALPPSPSSPQTQRETH